MIFFFSILLIIIFTSYLSSEQEAIILYGIADVGAHATSLTQSKCGCVGIFSGSQLFKLSLLILHFHIRTQLSHEPVTNLKY